VRKQEVQTHSIVLRTLQDDSLEARDPFVELPLPVLERRFRDDDEMRARDAEVELEVAEERDCLERLSETLQTRQK
jgi:hypothetical protein